MGLRLHKLWVAAIAFVLVIAVAGGGFLVWATAAAAPMEEAFAAMRPSDDLAVESTPWLIFRPLVDEPSTGLILYPGGRVDPRAYAPAARAIAEHGYLVIIVPMPLNLAVLDSRRASEVMANFPEIEHWSVGGHSLGGAMAAGFANSNPGSVEGLVLWAAYPGGGDDLSGSDVRVVSIYGTQDRLATPEKIESSRILLPPDARFVAIEGGNHAQFGWYGPQSGDGEPMVGRSAQQEQVVQGTVELLADLSP